MLHLLTATGARPEAWAICQRLMRSQDYLGAVTWIVVDDGPEPQRITFERPGWKIVLIRPRPFWQPGENTQSRNLLAGLDAVPAGAKLVIIEDDDWYASDWLSFVSRQLGGADLVGENRSRYYNIQTRQGRQIANLHHASLCSTAMQGEALTTFSAVCASEQRHIDMNLWRVHKSRRVFTGHRVVGIKGLPGRDGIGMGHKDTFKGTADPHGVLLRQWVGADADVYRGMQA